VKILYGVQATGQGHISRARAMAEALARYPVQVDWLFSGRERQSLFDMEPFGEYLHRRGLTFTTRNGRIRHLRTVLDNNLPQFLRDVWRLNVLDYDIVVTDFEPVTAWAAKLRGVQTIGIGHQYAFGGNAPAAGDHWLPRLIMRNFAPVGTGLGLHWHGYDPHTLPPILDLGDVRVEQGEHYLVYLPFEDQTTVTRWLNGHGGYRFVQYATGLPSDEQGNVRRHPTSISAFKKDLHSCRGVICNSGFELLSECLELGKPALTKPLTGQTEQESNALALTELGYATAMYRLDDAVLGQWLRRTPAAPSIRFVDVARHLAEWLHSGCREPAERLSERLWQNSSTPATTLAVGRGHSVLQTSP
jgi:uncharacterized protein (TIGR00661 family)